MQVVLDLDVITQEQIIIRAAELLAVKLAEQQQLSLVYTVKQLADRLKCCESVASNLLAEQKIHYVCVGKKGYRITERAVRAYEDAA